eukprot:Gb_39191 [translate_table: standard]
MAYGQTGAGKTFNLGWLGEEDIIEMETIYDVGNKMIEGLTKEKVEGLQSNGPTNEICAMSQWRTTEPNVKGYKQDEDSDEKMDDAEEETGKTNKKFATPNAEKEQQLSASKTLKTPVTPGSKTVFVRNLAFSVDKDIVFQFFEDAREVVDEQLVMNDDGSLKGFGHVTFANEEVA